MRSTRGWISFCILFWLMHTNDGIPWNKRINWTCVKMAKRYALHNSTIKSAIMIECIINFCRSVCVCPCSVCMQSLLHTIVKPSVGGDGACYFDMKTKIGDSHSILHLIEMSGSCSKSSAQTESTTTKRGYLYNFIFKKYTHRKPPIRFLVLDHSSQITVVPFSFSSTSSGEANQVELSCRSIEDSATAAISLSMR